MPFRIALSGLNASSSRLQVIGNNIANASTTGFKESRAEFADIFATSNLGTTANAIGSGVRVAAVSQQFTQGNIGFTDNNLDLAISGQGFFILDDNGTQVYSRAGTFGVDREGFVVNNQNQRLIVFGADSAGNITGAQNTLQLDTSDIAPSATTAVDIDLNLDATAQQPAVAFNVANPQPDQYNNSTSLTVFDSLGSPHLMTMFYVKTANPGEWQTYTYIEDTTGAPQLASGPDPLVYDSQGVVTTSAVPPVSTPVFTANLAAPGNGAAALAVSMDYTQSSQFGSPFSVNALTQDGFATGRLSGIDIVETGEISARFTNGQSRILGQVALANFANPQGLRQLGDTQWAETFDSGAALISNPGSGSLGLVQSGALEGSNVDLTEQLVSMITAQRNFQANAQVITTADTITQTIINIR
jgi:flagellar hook protein FlgE